MNAVQFVGRQSHRRQNGLPLLLRDADENVAAAQIVKIIGEGAHRAEDSLRIPALLKLQPLPFHGLSVKDIINIDRQVHHMWRLSQNRFRENQIVPALRARK